MLYFSKLRICLVFFVALFFVFVSSSNFQYFENNFITKKINLGLDLQGGSYLLLEIDNDPVELQKLQNTTTVIRNFLKSKEVRFNDLKIENNKIIPTAERKLYVFPREAIEKTDKGKTGTNFNPKNISNYKSYENKFNLILNKCT